jgi:hypothetical protein
VICLSFLVGCVPVPLSRESPFDEPTVGFIKPGATTREEVNARLGSPYLTADEDRYLIYGKSKTTEVQIWPGHVNRSKTFWFYVVEFDRGGLVKSTGVVRATGMLLSDVFLAASDDTQCTSSGVCIAFEPMLVLAVDELDRKAKAFPVAADQCSIYFFTDGRDRTLNRILLYGRSATFNHRTAYFNWALKPGPFSISVEWYRHHAVPSEVSTMWHEVAAQKFECRAGDVLYLRYSIPGTFQADARKITQVGADEARARIANLKLGLNTRFHPLREPR